MCERVDQAHIKRAFQAGIEECIPIGALCHILRVHVLSFCMSPQSGGRLGKRRRSEFFFRLGRCSFFVNFLRLALLYNSTAHIHILREDDVNQMCIAPKKYTKLSFDPIIIAGRSQMTSLPADQSNSLAIIDPTSNFLYDCI